MARSKKASGRGSEDKSQAFENVKNQLAYCGLWCGSCLVGNGTLNDLAQKCWKGLTDYGVHEWGPKDIDYESFLKALAAIGAMEPCGGCLKGGGRTDCEIRACATEKGMRECVECSMHGTCENTRVINHMRSGALKVGMKVKDESGNRAKALEKWMAERGEE